MRSGAILDTLPVFRKKRASTKIGVVDPNEFSSGFRKILGQYHAVVFLDHPVSSMRKGWKRNIVEYLLFVSKLIVVMCDCESKVSLPGAIRAG